MEKFTWPKNYYGMANSLPSSDPRLPEMISDMEKHGFDETEIWDLKSTMLAFTIPRLKAFKENLIDGFGKTEEDIDVILEVFERHLANANSEKSVEYTYSKERVDELTNAWIMLAKIMPRLWI